MASKFIILSVTASLLFGAGCSKNRGWLSRNDYAEMQDPFMEPDSAVAKSGDPASKAAGRASLGDSDPALAEGRARVPGPRMASAGTTGPKPIRPAGASADMTENGRRVSPAAYPEEFADGALTADGTSNQKTAGVTSYSGPALSDFLQKKNAAARAAASTAEQLPERTVSSASATTKGSLNPAATRAALPAISPEAESFSNFLTDKSESVANTAQLANQQVLDVTTDANEFVSWAEQQKAANLSSANAARSAVSNAPAQAKETAAAAFQQTRQASREMADSMLAPEFDDAGGDAAVPLINRPVFPSVAPALSKAKAPAANNPATDENPFADSFEEFHSGGSTASESTSQKPAATSA
ncbi:MAG: hypothetical protein WKF77_31815, partial [Planctomycetaceae bacterium]